MSKARRKNNKYSVELKLKAVQDYIAGKGSYEALKEIYGLRSSTQKFCGRFILFCDTACILVDQSQVKNVYVHENAQ